MVTIQPNQVSCHVCYKFPVALYPDSTHTPRINTYIKVIQSSLIFMIMQIATLRSD